MAPSPQQPSLSSAGVVANESGSSNRGPALDFPAQQILGVAEVYHRDRARRSRVRQGPSPAEPSFDFLGSELSLSCASGADRVHDGEPLVEVTIPERRARRRLVERSEPLDDLKKNALQPLESRGLCCRRRPKLDTTTPGLLTCARFGPFPAAYKGTKMKNLYFAVIPAAFLMMACGGGSTPEPASPTAAAAEEKPAAPAAEAPAEPKADAPAAAGGDKPAEAAPAPEKK